MKFRTALMSALALMFVTLLAATADAGQLVNNTNQNIAVQIANRDPQGNFTWSATFMIPPGASVEVPPQQWFRHQTHIGSSNWGFPGSFSQHPNLPAWYFFLYGNEVRMSVTK